ncbi:MAG: sodium-translocating pyrophosphatase, partial [Candidatus Omnitrophota bacterium]|nr:sodium-translocating pyrophosphatase [Candidatus Omnitrophota bacterium]
METVNLLWLAPAASILALVFSGCLVYKILKEPRGSAAMLEIQDAVQDGAQAYIKRQYSVVIIFFAVVSIILYWMARKGYLEIYVPIAFLTGGFFSGLAGYIGMKVATKANSRTANGAITSLNKALQIAFSGGAVMGFCVVGLGLLDLSIWFYALSYFYRDMALSEQIQRITSTMLTFEMGASSMALFARVGGGIFTKAADVGADLVGKVEAGIPEDDPRNPAVIADNVGDNVGDVAGMGADLYESYVGTIVATMVLAVAAGLSFAGVTVTMSMAAVGVIASIIGTFFVRTREKANQKELLIALRKGIFISAALIFVMAYFVIKYVLGMQYIGVYGSVVSGLIAGIIIGLSTEYFTSDNYSPAKKVAESSQTGPATVIISGISSGMLSTAVPVLTVGGAILASYYLAGGACNFNMGLYGIGIASVGMLSTLGITLATDAYGPIADNAGGIAEMSKQQPYVRERTDALDALGNTTAATGKGFAIGSAALTSLALIAAYKDEIFRLGKDLSLNLLDPRIMVGLFIGGMLPFLFSSLTMRAVGRAASSIVLEVRRQFKEIRGLMEGTAKPDYVRCVEICTTAAQKEMVLPSLIAIISPIALGLLLGVEAVVGLLAGALACGFVMAIMMANAGGIWDNAKKYVEKGAFGGKGSLQHKALVVGDTIGDPF